MATALDGEDVRALLHLLGELRELGDDPSAWRGHLAAALQRLCGAEVVVVSELLVNPAYRGGAVAPSAMGNCAVAVRPLQIRDRGLPSSTRDSFFEDVYWTDHASDDALQGMVRLYGSAFTVRRQDVVQSERWYRSTFANERYRKHNCGDFTISMSPVDHLGVVCSVEMFRAWRGTSFSLRDRLLLDLIHGELSRDWQRAQRGLPRLTRRQGQILLGLAQGASEKELAHELGLSGHTVHDHVKAVHRAFGARSRGELLAKRAAVMAAPRVRLIAESQ